MTEFVPGASLSRAFYDDVLASVVGVPHAAALLGTGSDVLGYDTARSTDHDWGPRGVIFVAEGAIAGVKRAVAAALPEKFRGWPVSIGRAGVPFRPQIEVAGLARWTMARLGVDPLESPMLAGDWLCTPQQRILEVVSGEVFHDDTGDLTRLRAALAWYPDDVWWWLIACQWRRLAQEEAFVQRAAEVGDELGSAVVTSRLVRDAMRLALLFGHRYAPYTKWLGTSFARLEDSDGLGRHLKDAVRGTALRECEDSLGAALQVLAGRFNALAPGPDLDTRLSSFHDRPARVLGSDRFAAAALTHVRDHSLRALPLIGAIDQLVDNVDVLTSPELCRQLRPLWKDV